MVATRTVPELIWHDLECGAYRADLPLWLALAADAAPADSARVLDLGAGSGRVALALAAAGHEVTALDRSPTLLEALRERAGSLPVCCVLADVRDFEPPAERPHDLCLVPMQTLQLLRGPAERSALFAGARAALRPGGRLACAIVTDVEEFDVRRERYGPDPESVVVDGVLYESRAVRVTLDERFIRIERRRTRDGAASELDVVELERLDAARVAAEGLAVALRPQPSLRIAATEDHAGSLVAVFDA